MEKFSYLNRSNLEYIDSLYSQYQASPDSVELEWRRFFEGMEFSKGGTLSEKDLSVYRLIQSYRDYGHFEAHLNPLANTPAKSEELVLSRFGLTDADLNQQFRIGPFKGTLKEIIENLKKIYCGTLSIQVAETAPLVREWFTKEMEECKETAQFSKEEKLKVLSEVIITETFEKFLHTRFVGAKRFSVEGGDVIVPMLEKLMATGLKIGMEEIVIGMAHRGRLSILTNFMGKGYADIFSEFDGTAFDEIEGIDGDVKYHIGYSTEKKSANGNCTISLAFNPSHLEAVNPVVLGMVRARQRVRQDTGKRKKVVSILIHGDSAFAGQGIVLETLQMSQLKGYTVGGTVHVIIDNQVGFTADTVDTRSSPYSSDVAKALLAPVIHVNGDDVEACVRAMDMAIRFRQEFGSDVVVNMICYRRYGHNESDEPAFTQPLMYKIIKDHPTLSEIYGQKLISEKITDQKSIEKMFQDRMDYLQKILEENRKNPAKLKFPPFEGMWKGLRRGEKKDFEKTVNTKTDMKTLKKVGEALTTFPKGFTPHPKIAKLIIEGRSHMMTGEKPVDWGTAELLACGSLILEGNSVRISGQDCGRGTFSHRHAVLYDVNTGEPYTPLKTLNHKQEYCVYDSLLSEYGVLGFEYGNSISDPTFLTIWEAQYGDFMNGAQIIIDQFITSGESKWMQMTGLVLSLPHGFEGSGPEHSSARLERFMQACAQENIQVCSLTTPAQYFHVLRRQIKRDFRKPLVLMSPKSLLRHPKVHSSLEDLASGSFQEILLDSKIQDYKNVEQFVFCTGKAFYDVDDARDKAGIKSDKIAVIRLEQLYPFPAAQIKNILNQSKKIRSITWVQEEPHNMGAHNTIAPWFEDVMKDVGLKDLRLNYIGRTSRASPATGSMRQHEKEQHEIIEKFLNLYK